MVLQNVLPAVLSVLICLWIPALLKLFFLFSFGLFISTSYAGEWTGNVAVQARYFINDPLPQNSQQHNTYLSTSAEPEYFHEWDDGNQTFTFTPFVRLDQHDDERTHGDIRELVWHKVFDTWELKAGISKVFWGVTESNHLVDVINQTDNVENIDGEDKLGQPMINASIERDWGVIDVFLLPYFRERTFADEEGRPRFFPVGDALYESSDEENHIDYALRLLNYLGEWEVGLSYFDGTSREPTFNQFSNQPFYRQMQQYGLDAQMTTEEWLWKIEAIRRNWSAEDFLAVTAGFEYTFVGIYESDADLGLVIEYLYDDRGDTATTFFEDDVLTGLRLTLNDEQSTEALLGVIVDTETEELIISLEASRRLGDSWKLELETRSFHNNDSNSLAYAFRDDDFIQVDLAYYF